MQNPDFQAIQDRVLAGAPGAIGELTSFIDEQRGGYTDLYALIETLRETNTPHARAALVALVSTDDEDACYMSLEALCWVSLDASNLDALAPCLNMTEHHVRARVALVMARSGDRRGGDVLAEYLRPDLPNDHQRPLLDGLLEAIPHREVVFDCEWAPMLEEYGQMALAIVPWHPDVAWPWLRAILQEWAEFGVLEPREELKWMLLNRDDPFSLGLRLQSEPTRLHLPDPLPLSVEAREPLIAWLRRDVGVGLQSWQVTELAVYGLTVLGEEEPVRAWVAAERNQSLSGECIAATAVHRFRWDDQRERVAARLCTLIREWSLEERILWEHLGLLGGETAWSSLIRGLDDPPLARQRDPIWGLGRSADPRALPLLIEQLGAPEYLRRIPHPLG